jgi:2-oxoglutarate dehydrogenase E1 component
VHGDAAFIAQGVVAETLNLSQLHGYSTGGTIHVVVNNQIGFTTLPKDARSSRYATDIAKMIEAPIFHVNGDDPLAVAFVGDLAFDFRQQFGRDVVIDLYCYRRYGHNEGDEPSFTQPDLYAKIEKRPSVTQLYKRELLDAGTLSEDDAASLETEFALRLEMTRDEVNAIEKRRANQKAKFRESTAIFQPEYTSESEPTAISEKTLKTIVEGLTRVPDGFEVQSKIQRIVIDHQRQVFEDGGPYEWHFAEALAFGSLLLEGIPVRLSGQDSSRGTFSTRHSVLYDAKTGKPYVPLMHLAEKQARICIYNSPLSEAAVLGFDYGYSLEYPKMLCLWEAQFGDFMNGAQTIIDQFIVSAESKWQRPSGIVLLLPHGYEGQGPEHSSGRIERYLQLAAKDNIQVAQPSTAAQYFHLLRRQALRSWRKPLIVFTPKGMLRHPDAASPLSELSNGKFQTVIQDPEIANAERIIVCSGKVGHELRRERKRRGDTKTAIVFLEQLFPLPEAELEAAFAQHTNAREFLWVQEEPANMGALNFLAPQLERLARGAPFRSVKRSPSSSPSTGSHTAHEMEQKTLLELAFKAF